MYTAITMVRLTERDYLILETMASCDGLMSANQIAQLLFPNRHITRMYETMRRLAKAGYVNQPTDEEEKQYPTWVYWLALHGYEVLAERNGTEVTKADKSRGKHRFSPLTIKHMLGVNDVHIAALQAAPRAGLTFERWVGELQFRRMKPDKLKYRRIDTTIETRNVIPDGFFMVKRDLPNDKEEMFAFLVELDRGTEHEERLANEKYRAGTVFFRSKTFREELGLNFGRWLVVTDRGDGRMNHMRQWCVKSGTAPAFYFSTLDRLIYGSRQIFTDPLWFLADQDDPVSIIPRMS
jgi:hypothetical protein